MQTLQACDLAYSGGHAYSPNPHPHPYLTLTITAILTLTLITGSLSYLGAECPQIVCGPPIQILKVVKAHKDTIRCCS